MRKLIVLAVLLGLLAVGDVAARSYAEQKIAGKVQTSANGAVGAQAEIESFPFLGRLGATGEVPRLQVRIDRLRRERLEFANFVLDLRGVVLERGALMNGRIEVTEIDRGSIAIDLDAGALGRLIGENVQIADGKVVVTVAGRTLEAELEVVEGPALRFKPGPLQPITLRLPVETLMPCTPSLLFISSRARLSCSFDDVPPALLRAAAEVQNPR